MKKFLLILLIFTLVGVFAFAEDLTVEERLDALEAAPAPITLTGSMSFGLGANFDTDGTNLPLATSAKTATADIKLSTANEKVTADLSLNLLAVPTVSVVMDNTDSLMYSANSGYNPEEYSIGPVEDFNALTAEIDFWNTYAETELPNAGTPIWAATEAARLVVRTTITTQADSGTGGIDVLVRTDADADDLPAITLKDLVQSAPAAATEFILIDGDVVPSVSTQLTTAVENALDRYFADASAAILKTFPISAAWGVAPGYYDQIVDDLNNLTKVQIATLGDADRDVINDALAFAKAYDEVGTNPMDLGMTATVTQNFITAASITLHGVANVADVKMNFGGQHLTAGAIALDESGHTEDAVTGYPSVAFTLDSGVVEGLSAGAEFFFDDNAAMADKALIVDLDDDIYTWMDESVAQVDPKLGFSVNAGYELALADDMTVGVNAAVAQYDFLADDSDDAKLGYSLGGSFAGMGANFAAQMDSGLDMMYVAVDADYTVAGFTPYVAFDMITLDDAGDYNLAYVATTTSVMADLKKEGGMVLGGGVKADLESYIGMPATLSGGAEYGIYDDTDEDSVLAWNAAVSVTPLAALVVNAGLSADAIKDEGNEALAWNAGAAYTLSETLGFSAGVANNYYAADDLTAVTYNVGMTYTHGAAVVTGTIGTAYDADQAEATTQYSILTTVKF